MGNKLQLLLQSKKNKFCSVWKYPDDAELIQMQVKYIAHWHCPAWWTGLKLEKRQENKQTIEKKCKEL